MSTSVIPRLAGQAIRLVLVRAASRVASLAVLGKDLHSRAPHSSTREALLSYIKRLLTATCCERRLAASPEPAFLIHAAGSELTVSPTTTPGPVFVVLTRWNWFISFCWKESGCAMFHSCVVCSRSWSCRMSAPKLQLSRERGNAPRAFWRSLSERCMTGHTCEHHR